MDQNKFFNLQDVNIFANPSRIIIAGYSNSGKSEMCKKLILKYEKQFDHIIYCGVDSHELQNSNIKHKFQTYNHIVNPFDHVELIDRGLLIVIDDLFEEAINTKSIVDTFTKGRHKKISVVFITQNIFANGKYSRSIALNTSHFILMRNRDLAQVENIGRQVYGKGKSGILVEIYKKALSYNKYGYLLIDLSPNTPTDLQLRTNIVNETEYEVVFQGVLD